MPDPRHPVIVGAAQATWRDGGAPDPIEMGAQVVAAAAADAGAGDTLLRRAGALGVVDIASRRWQDPGALVASRLGIAPAETLRTNLGGDGPQVLVSHLATRIEQGDLDAGIVCGAEALATLGRALREGGGPADWPPLDEGAAPTRVLGSDRAPATEAEIAANLIAPVVMYPLFEDALWAGSPAGPDEHRARLGELWARFSQVAARNPHAWSRRAHRPEEIATPGPGNRLVTLPYTKLLNSNIQTDQAAALILCSESLARELGIARERWVFPHAAAHAHDHWFVTEREDLRSSPAIRFATRSALAAAGADIDEVAHLDVYSCFPSAVQVACRELGVDPWTDPRPLTVTGGLTFAGGPGNNYVTHSIAAMVERLREDPGALGLTTAVGWYLTKHAVGLYGTRTPRGPFTAASVQDEVDATPRRATAEGRAGRAEAEAASVIFDREGRPAVGALTALFADGARGVAKATDPETLAAMTSGRVAGAEAHLDGEGAVRL